MIITKTFCDICSKECDKKRFGVVSGCVVKLDESATPKDMFFEGHYCSDDIAKIIEYIQKLNEQTGTGDNKTE